ncbi:MAG: homoserine O-succinyltransferase [marine bacterium B5-7]|nr:MAG: homoserine O-succinyltransferase [marine bacterium B5-7]
MPLVANTKLPGFTRLRSEGEEVLDSERAQHQDIRELHIGLLNMMPDAALEVTERQFMRLVGGCNRIAQFYVYPFSPGKIPRGKDARDHIDRYYFDFEDIRKEGLDALIITGAIPGVELSKEPFWEPLGEVLDWARENVTSTLCACLATHAALQYLWGIERRPLGFKRWGVYHHRRTRPHPLVRNINTRFDVPHSRFNEIYAEQMQQHGIRVLVESEEAGVHLATSPDGFRFVFFQGHPEYDQNSLLKEYKREVVRFTRSEIKQYPPFPEHYLSEAGKHILDEFRRDLLESNDPKATLEKFPEERVLAETDYTWGDTGKIIFNNWLGLVYQITGTRRDVPFMDGVDPTNPLNLEV